MGTIHKKYLATLTPVRRCTVAKKLGLPTIRPAQRSRTRGDERLLAKARPLTPKEIHEDLLEEPCGEADILKQLTVRELRSVCDQFHISPPRPRQTRAAIVESIVGQFRREGCIRAYDDYPPEIDYKPDALEQELEDWADEFCRCAEADGVEPDFAFADFISPVESTIRLVCEVYNSRAATDFLSWQQYGGPKRRGPWYILEEFYEPPKWFHASVYIKSPSDIDF